MKRRTTASQGLILNALQKANGALSHEMIHEEFAEDMNRATIYRILNRFHEDGIVHRIVGEDGKQFFALCASSCQSENHHHDHFHFQCVECGKVECLQTEIQIKLPKGYVQKELNAVVSGHCNDCNPPI